MFGRDYRKLISQIWAYVIFRWIVVWVLIVLASGIRGGAGEAAALVIICIDIVAGSLGRVTALALATQSRKDWLDRLTNRCFYKLLWERLRADTRADIDIDDLFKLAGQDALADIKLADDAERLEAGFFDRRGWHFFGGVMSFVGLLIGLVTYYGSALYIGSDMHR
jgi:hypothetical protein